MISLTSHVGSTTIVTVGAEPGTVLEGYSATAKARCAPTDVYVPEVGTMIALGRAIQELGRQVEDDALSLTITKDDMAKALDTLELLGFLPVVTVTVGR